MIVIFKMIIQSSFVWNKNLTNILLQLNANLFATFITNNNFLRTMLAIKNQRNFSIP